MIQLPSVPQTFMGLFGRSLKYHYAILKKIFWLIVMLVVVKDLPIYFGGMPDNVYFHTALAVIIGLVLVYLFTAMLYAAHCVLYSEDVNWKSALIDVWPKYGRVLLVVVLLALLPVLVTYISMLIAKFVDIKSSGGGNFLFFGGMLLGALIIFLVYMYFFFVIPSIVFENVSILDACGDSYALSRDDWTHLVRIFGVYVFVGLMWALVSSGTLHGHLLQMYKLSAVFDFVVFVVLLPIILSLVVLMRNDLRYRNEIEES